MTANNDKGAAGPMNGLNTFDSSEIETEASHLYDGGWRSTDRDLIIEEYGVTPEYADAICGELAGIEEFSRKEKKEPEFFTDSEGLLRMRVSE